MGFARRRAKFLAVILVGLAPSGAALAQEAPGPADGRADAPPQKAAPPVESAPPPPMPRAPLLRPEDAAQLTSGLGADLSVGFGFLGKPPDMTLGTPEGQAMPQFANDPLRHLAWMPMVTLGVSGFYRTASVLTIPLLGFEFGIPVSTGYPGSVPLMTKGASLSWTRGGPTFYDGLDILGVGLQLGSGSFRFGADVVPGFRFLRTIGSITQGALTVDAEASEYSFSLRVDVEACLGAKGAFSGCVYGAPHVYELGSFLNGAVFGLRVETN